jgi:uncharacterized membrane protein
MSVEIILYTRNGCELCDQAADKLRELGRAMPLDVTPIDVDSDPILQLELGDQVPVIEVEGNRLESPLDWETVTATLISAAAHEQVRQSKKATGRKRDTVLRIDRGILWLAKHWVGVLTVIVGLYASVPFLAPLAMEAGFTGLGTVIYRVYSPVCHQFSFRSWFLFGDQTVYPRERAGIDQLGSFEDYAAAEPAFNGIDLTTLDTDLIYAAKRFVGSPRMGWKVAFCERDVSIYAAITLFGLIFIVLRRAGVTIPKLPFWAYLLIAIAPIGLDGFSQYFANPPFNSFGLAWYPIRESTPFLRVLTGSLFGLGNAWLAYPYIEESMRETVTMLERKLTRAGEMAPSTAASSD